MAMPGLSPAAASLGLGDKLASQVSGETDEQRKKKMADMQAAKLAGPMASLAVTSLFGANGGRGEY